MEEKLLTADEVQAVQDDRYRRNLAIKAFQARTTYELCFNSQLGANLNCDKQARPGSSGLANWQTKNRVALRAAAEPDISERDSIA